MSQKVQIYKNNNKHSESYGKYFVRAVYDKKFITTDELADFIQQQCTVKRSDCKAVLDELGSAMKHFFEQGQKIRLDGIGIFKVGISSKAVDSIEACTAAGVSNSRVLFQPETTAIATGKTAQVERAKLVKGVPTKVSYQMATFTHPATMLKDIRFEMAHDSLSQSVLSEPADDQEP